MNPIILDECKVTDLDTFQCLDGKEYFVRNVYPPLQELQPRVFFVVIIFFLCFIVGICGNSFILTIIRGIIIERKSNVNAHSAARRNSDNAILYIAALCVVDFLMSLSLPPAILDSVIGFWVFGTVICKLHHICGSVGRIVSTFLITAMSFDRFVAICYPYKTIFRSRRFVICTIITLWTLAFLLLLPMLTYAKANELLLHQITHPTNLKTGIENVTRVRVYKCSDMMPSFIFYWFTSSTFVLGYLVPLVLIVFFNSRLIRKLYRHAKILPSSGIPLRRISIYTILLAAIYFICWTPYWCSVLYAIYISLITDTKNKNQSQFNELLLFIIYCVHILPYFGSASNWILYGLLNTQLQMRHDTQSTGNTDINTVLMTSTSNKIKLIPSHSYFSPSKKTINVIMSGFRSASLNTESFGIKSLFSKSNFPLSHTNFSSSTNFKQKRNNLMEQTEKDHDDATKIKTINEPNNNCDLNIEKNAFQNLTKNENSTSNSFLNNTTDTNKWCLLSVNCYEDLNKNKTSLFVEHCEDDQTL